MGAMETNGLGFAQEVAKEVLSLAQREQVAGHDGSELMLLVKVCYEPATGAMRESDRMVVSYLIDMGAGTPASHEVRYIGRSDLQNAELKEGDGTSARFKTFDSAMRFLQIRLNQHVFSKRTDGVAIVQLLCKHVGKPYACQVRNNTSWHKGILCTMRARFAPASASYIAAITDKDGKYPEPKSDGDLSSVLQELNGLALDCTHARETGQIDLY